MGKDYIFGGKVFAFGEWSALLPGSVSGLLYIENQVKLEILEESSEFLEIECQSGRKKEYLRFNGKEFLDLSDPSFLSLIQKQITETKTQKKGKIRIISSDDDSKWGFGSSAAVSLALLKYLEQG